MNQNFSVSFESPQSGWMSMRLRAGAEQLVLGVSYAPYDSLRDLIVGLTALLRDGQGFVVRWNCEPEEYDLRVAATATDEEIELGVTRYPDHRRRQTARQTVFSHRAPKMEICLAFWRELRELRRRSNEDVFDKNWRRPYPQAEMQEFTKLIRALKRS
ncbi:MAG TPA: hypothetical protein VF666_09260 [Pyrinomonadaceae bacterium]|jgi:hypothetical protein